MNSKRKKTILHLSNIGYIIGCVTLYIFSLAVIFLSVGNIFSEIYEGSFTVYKLLDEVALVVFSIAVIDVAKFLMVEEVLKDKEHRDPVEMRKTLTEFGVIIATALSLEGLVLTIETAKSDVTKMLYPMSLLVTAIFFIVAIGVYQKLNKSAEG